jgi:hypothetical protein
VAAGGDDRLGQPAGHLPAMGRSSMRQGAPCQVSIFKEKSFIEVFRIRDKQIQGQKDSRSASKNLSF